MFSYSNSSSTNKNVIAHKAHSIVIIVLFGNYIERFSPLLISHLKSGNVFDVLIIWFWLTNGRHHWVYVPPMFFHFSIVLSLLFFHLCSFSFPLSQIKQPMFFQSLLCPLLFICSVNNTRMMMRQWQFIFFTTGNPLNIHVAFSRSFSVRRVVNFPKFQFILSPGPLGHPPITPLCSSNWAGQDAPPTLQLSGPPSPPLPP